MLRRLLARLSSRLRTDADGDRGYRALTVTSRIACCEAARATHAHPLLVQSIPLLPLPACTMPDDCRCRFREWPDRRIGERRFVSETVREPEPTPSERRARRERRKPR